MPAAVAKGIIVSISIIAALSLAVVENPQVQQWLEEQRRKIADLLRQIGEDLDPQSRRTAEAFAFEGRATPADDGLHREETGSRDAAEVATGRSLSNASTVRRIPVKGPADPNEAEERRRKGREYLAQRNQQMHELQQKRKAAAAAATEDTPDTDTTAATVENPPSPTFDELVDAEGNLKRTATMEKDLPSPPAVDPLPLPVRAEMKEVERHLSQPILVGESSSSVSSGWQTGSTLSNPFSDDYALDRSITPKPPVPPKIELDRPLTPPISVPGGFEQSRLQQAEVPVNHAELSYEEQLAIALSLSEQESAARSAAKRRSQEDDAFKAAIAASLKDMDGQKALRAATHTGTRISRPMHMETQTLVDLTPIEPQAVRPPRGNWATMISPSHEPLSLAPPTKAPSEASDELYRVTPELTRARLATFEAQQSPMQVLGPTSSAGSSLPFDPVREAAREPQAIPDVMDASFHSALDVVSPQPSSVTMDHETPQLIDFTEDMQPEGARTPTSRAHSSFGFQTDSDTETFASVSVPASRAQSRPRSEVSNVEVIDLVEDSDVDMLSEEGDGIATPDSWSEVGSRDADSEMEDDYPPQHSRMTS